MRDNSPSIPFEQKQISSQNKSGATTFSRVGSSTSTLLKDAVLHTRPEQITSCLSSSFSSSGKGESSTGFPEVSSSTSQHLQEQRHDSGKPSSPRYDESFRTQAQANQAISVQHEFDSFTTAPNKLLSPDYPSTSYLNDGIPQRNGKQRAVAKENGAAVIDLPADPTFRLDEEPHQACGSEMKEKIPGILKEDGAAVVALLADPTFDIDEPPRDDYDKRVEEENYPYWQRSAEFQKILAKFKSKFPPAAFHKRPSPANPVNLLPNFNNQEYTSRGLSAQSVDRTHIGTGLATSGNDLEPWLEVLTSYQDHVWGDLLPLVREAREEVNAAAGENAQAPYDGPAVRRLGMILSHIGGLSKPQRKHVE